MNTTIPSGSDDAAVRLTAAALGETVPPRAPSAEELAEMAATRALADELSAALKREPLPFVNAGAIASRVLGEQERPGRRRGTGFAVTGGGARHDRTGLSWLSFGAVAAAACVALVLVSGSRTPRESRTVAAQPAAGGISISLPAATRPASMATLLAGMPGLPEAGGEFRPAGRASLARVAPHARAYTDLLRRELQAGRVTPATRIRTDALVNAFIAGRSVFASGDAPVQVESVLTEAPWGAGQRVLRVTVRGCGRAGETAATQVAAVVDFPAGVVKGWRLLGHEGVSGLRRPATLRAGDAVTTLFEIDPQGGVSAEALVAAVKVDYTASGRRESRYAAVTEGACAPFVQANADTRFAAGLAAYARDRSAESARALVGLAGTDSDRLAFAKAASR